MDQKQYGAALASRRVSAGLTQADVAYSLGYTSAQFISNMERGICKLPIAKIPVFARLVKMSEHELLQMHLKVVEASIVQTFPPRRGRPRKTAKGKQ